MKHATFVGETVIEGRRVRRLSFERKSAIPREDLLTAASLVCARLSTLAQIRVEAAVLEPSLPDEAAWNAIARDAIVVAVRGKVTDVAMVLRPRAASVFAGLLFREPDIVEREVLSRIEAEAVIRASGDVLQPFERWCGAQEGALATPVDLRHYRAYWELVVERPWPMSVGFALAGDPVSPSPRKTIRLQDLEQVEVELRVELARGDIALDGLARLAIGQELPMTSRISDDGRLLFEGGVPVPVACGERRGRAAAVVQSLPGK